MTGEDGGIRGCPRGKIPQGEMPEVPGGPMEEKEVTGGRWGTCPGGDAGGAWGRGRCPGPTI